MPRLLCLRKSAGAGRGRRRDAGERDGRCGSAARRERTFRLATAGQRPSRETLGSLVSRQGLETSSEFFGQFVAKPPSGFVHNERDQLVQPLNVSCIEDVNKRGHDPRSVGVSLRSAEVFTRRVIDRNGSLRWCGQAAVRI